MLTGNQLFGKVVEKPPKANPSSSQRGNRPSSSQRGNGPSSSQRGNGIRRFNMQSERLGHSPISLLLTLAFLNFILRVLLFSQMTSLMTILEDYFNWKGNYETLLTPNIYP